MKKLILGIALAVGFLLALNDNEANFLPNFIGLYILFTATYIINKSSNHGKEAKN